MESRFFYSLFWFCEGNSGDGLALDELREEKIDTAIRLLNQLSHLDINKSFSSAKNLSVLYLALGRNNGTFSFENFSKGIMWAGTIMNTDFLSAYANQIAGKPLKFERDKIVDLFIDEIVRTVEPKLNKIDDISLAHFIANFSNFPDAAKRKVANRFIAKHLQTIDAAIALSGKNIKDSPAKAHLAAWSLWESTEKVIKVIRESLGADDYNYQSCADKLAIAIEACGIAYYNYHHKNETSVDPGDSSLKIAEYARSLATAVSTKNRIDEGIKIIEKWVEGKSEREKFKRVNDSIDFVVEKLDSLPDIEDIPENNYWRLIQITKSLLNDCRVPLTKIKNAFGPEADNYLCLSSAVVRSAMGMCVEYVNETDKLTDVVEIFKTIATFDMDTETKTAYQHNNTIFMKNCAVEKNLNPIKEALENITDMSSNSIDKLVLLPGSVDKLIHSVRNHLAALKDIDFKLYLNASSAVANTSINLCIEYANQSGNLGQVLDLMNKIELLDMEPVLRARFNENLRILKNNESASRQSSKKRGCYIATMVYGDYDAPQVLVLRRFRDTRLSKSWPGRHFINCYYKLSPGFVKHFGCFRFVHLTIRYVLDRIVRRLS